MTPLPPHRKKTTDHLPHPPYIGPQFGPPKTNFFRTKVDIEKKSAPPRTPTQDRPPPPPMSTPPSASPPAGPPHGGPQDCPHGSPSCCPDHPSPRRPSLRPPPPPDPMGPPRRSHTRSELHQIPSQALRYIASLSVLELDLPPALTLEELDVVPMKSLENNPELKSKYDKIYRTPLPMIKFSAIKYNTQQFVEIIRGIQNYRDTGVVNCLRVLYDPTYWQVVVSRYFGACLNVLLWLSQGRTEDSWFQRTGGGNP